MNKLTITAKRLDTFFKIFHIAVTVLAVSALVCLGVIAFGFLLDLNPDMLATGYDGIDVGFLELELAEDFVPDKHDRLLQTAIQLVLNFVFCLFGRASISCIREILKPMTNNEPFSSIVSTNLKKLGKLTIALGIGMNLVKLVDQLILVFALDLPSLLISEKIIHVGGTFTFDLSFLAVTALLFLLSYVFHYGEELQQLSDETL